MSKTLILLASAFFTGACSGDSAPSERDYFAMYAAMEELCPQLASTTRTVFLAGLRNAVADTRRDKNEALKEYDTLKADRQFLDLVKAQIRRAKQDPPAVLEKGCREVETYAPRPDR